MSAPLPASALASPTLSRSQLAFRIGLVRQRTRQYPLHKLDFIMMDLERPDLSHRHADWCAGDLSGRLLECLSVLDGVDGQRDDRLPELFDRILRTRRASGLFGRYSPHPTKCLPPEEDVATGIYRLFNGFLRYYELSGDHRALEAAAATGDWFVANRDRWRKRFANAPACALEYWITEPLARLYHHTGDNRYLDFIAMIDGAVTGCDHVHAHGCLATLRGLQLAALYTGDMGWNEKPERYRRLIIDRHYEMADGCIGEMLPRGFRNEGCAIADWLMLNLNAGLLGGGDEAYAAAENIVWNALFFNQFVTGGFGHRDLLPHGYALGPLSEAWWCCTEHACMAMGEVARHVVTRQPDGLHINLLFPGRFTVGETEVVITTAFPAAAQTTIHVCRLPPGEAVALRVPGCIRHAAVTETRTADGLILKLDGRLGHWLQPYEDKQLLRYGPVILSPLTYYWNTECKSVDSNVPDGYIPRFLPAGIPRLQPGVADADGLLTLAEAPTPDWSYFETGPDAELSVEGASVHVPVLFPGGEAMTLWFSPLCHITSDMSYYDTPILFPV